MIDFYAHWIQNVWNNLKNKALICYKGINLIIIYYKWIDENRISLWFMHIVVLLRANKINFIIFLCDETLFYTARLHIIVLSEFCFIRVIIKFEW